jgi:thioredoxin-like negative regulator of GroEL
MKKAIRNVDSFSGKPSANQIASVLDQIDAMRAGNGEQAAPQGQATQDRPALSQRKTEAEQP